MQSKKMEVVHLKTSEVKPYWRNPRIHSNTKELEESIIRYGFTVPIIVDKENVIIAGHGRFKAALSLKLETVPCIVRDDLSKQKVKEFRLVDNKVSEMSILDQEKALQEMREIQDLDQFLFFFPEYQLDDILQSSKEAVEQITLGDIAESQNRLDHKYQNASETYKNALIPVTCPHCLESFEIDKSKLQ